MGTDPHDLVRITAEGARTVRRLLRWWRHDRPTDHQDRDRVRHQLGRRYGLPYRETVTASGTWTAPGDINRAVVVLIGGGGGGAGGLATVTYNTLVVGGGGGGAGQSGGVVIAYLQAAPSAGVKLRARPLAVTIGTGGSAGSAGANGSDGVASSVADSTAANLELEAPGGEGGDADGTPGADVTTAATAAGLLIANPGALGSAPAITTVGTLGSPGQHGSGFSTTSAWAIPGLGGTGNGPITTEARHGYGGSGGSGAGSAAAEAGTAGQPGAVLFYY